MSEEQEFWDDFAAEYAEIQQESQLTIAEDLATFLKTNGILPISSFVDLAAGSGRYIPAILPDTKRYLAIDFSVEMLKAARRYVKDPQQKVDFRLQTQAEFLADKTTYSLIFTAMNPALTEKDQLISLVEKSRRLLILRIVRTKENIFQPLEQNDPKDEKLLSVYKKWLLEEQIRFSTHLFSYAYEEIIDREFFYRYFQQDIPQSELLQLSRSLFGEKKKAISKTEIDYELLIV
ncbi:methyltransferase domain-containing protein [Enterococcus gallinarum]